MDRLATLLVSQDKADVSAVVYVPETPAANIEEANLQNAEVDKAARFFYVKNSGGKCSGPANTPPAVVKASSIHKIGKDWLKNCLKQ